VAGDFLLSGPIRFTFGGPIHNLWPLLMLPALAAWAADRSAARLPRTPAASLPALVLAAAPGLLTLLLMANIALSLQGFVTWRGWILYRLTPAVAVALAAYAAVGLVRRQLALRRVFRIARPPSERLSRHALALGLRARELPTPDLECFVAGALRPTVFVSAGAGPGPARARPGRRRLPDGAGGAGRPGGGGGGGAPDLGFGVAGAGAAVAADGPRPAHGRGRDPGLAHGGPARRSARGGITEAGDGAVLGALRLPGLAAGAACPVGYVLRLTA
jgi:hypothetical protein